ncbi:MAG: AMP-binding protein, partial [Gemmatimonadota bacterium]
MSPLFKERPAPALRRPLTPAERPIFTSQALNPGKPLFNMALAVEVAAPLDPERLQDALRRVALGSDALRTVVRSEQGVPWAEVLEECDTTLEVEERPDAVWSDGSLRLELEDRARQHLPMDRPMTRVALFRGRTRSTLFVLQHHLITDALSLGVLLRRLGEAYAGPTRAGVSDPVETPQFMAYVQHLDGAPARDALHRASAFWKETTPQDTAPLRFYGRGADGEGRTHRARVALEGERARTLERLASLPEFRAFSREQSRFLVLSTVLSAWMARITDREEVAVGVPCHHRTATAFRETLGLFMELCPLRVQVQPDTSFRALAEQVRRATTETLRHAVPGAGALPEARGFGVVLNVITAELGRFAGHEVRADWIHAGAGDPAHPVRIQLHDFDGSGTPTMDFDLDESVFGPEERRWAVDHFLALLDALDADMDARVSEVRLVEWEDEASFATRGEDRFPPAGILSSFGAVLAERDHEVALVEGTTGVTFRELADRALELEGRLGEGANLAPGDVVGILMDRGTDLVTAMLAVMRTGAAYMTLDPAHPDERLAAQLRDAGASLVITTPERCDRVRPWGPAPVTLGSGESAGPGPERGPDTRETGGARADSALQPWPDPPPDRLAYVLYTSGSTGRPKGVEVSHGALAEYVAWAARTWDRGDRLTWAWFTSPAYDLTVTSIFTPLVSGGSIVVFPEDPDGGRLTVLDVFADPRVEVVKLTPSHLALLGSLDLSGSRVRRLVLGGENLPVALARAAHEAFGEEVEIYNEYGPTEATVGCMIHRFDPEMDTGDSVPIGVPADNVQIHVLSPAGTPTVRGESGEICIAGTRLARGYRGRPDLTE